MGFITKLFIAPASAIQEIADSPSVRFPSSDTTLESLDDIALIRLQALTDGVTGWDGAFDTIAIEFESEPHAESDTDDGSWSHLVPERFIRAFAALSDSDIQRLVPVWADPETHAGRRLSALTAAAMIRAVRDLCSRALGDGSAVIFSTRE